MASKEQKELIRGRKLVYQAINNKDADEKILNNIEVKWGKDYPLAIKSWRNNWERQTAYCQYSQLIRRIIYNTVKGYHHQFRKATQNKGVFTANPTL